VGRVEHACTGPQPGRVAVRLRHRRGPPLALYPCRRGSAAVKQFNTEIRRYVTPMYFRSVDNLVAGVMVTLIRATERMRRTHSPPAISVDRFPVTPPPALPNHPPLCPVVRSGARRMVPPGLPQPATSWQPSPPAPPRTPTDAATPHQTHQPTSRKQVPHQRNGPDEPSVVPPEATTNPRVTLRETVPYALGRARDVVGGLEDRVFGQRPTHAVPPTVSGAVTGRDVVGLLPR
jgi:hypothetical protein